MQSALPLWCFYATVYCFATIFVLMHKDGECDTRCSWLFKVKRNGGPQLVHTASVHEPPWLPDLDGPHATMEVARTEKVPANSLVT